jgi:ElaB/YqjD/DUF883 family membrane-anchored ribosome-binding protein
MKHAIIILTLFGGSFAFGQSESRVEKKFERYENGELKEDKYYLEENGRAIEGEDFEMPEFEEIQGRMEVKHAEMEQRMQEMQQRADQMMQKARQDMEQRMNEMQQGMNQMQQEMDMKMQQQKPGQSPQMTPPANNNSTPNSLGTTFQT